MNEKIKNLSPTAARVVLWILLDGPKSTGEIKAEIDKSTLSRIRKELDKFLIIVNGIYYLDSQKWEIFSKMRKILKDENNSFSKMRKILKDENNSGDNIESIINNQCSSSTSNNIYNNKEEEQFDSQVIGFMAKLQKIGVYCNSHNWNEAAVVVSSHNKELKKITKRIERYFLEYQGNPEYKMSKPETILGKNLMVFLSDKNLEDYLRKQKMSWEKESGCPGPKKSRVGHLDSYKGLKK